MRSCRNCGHNPEHHQPDCQRCRLGKRCKFFRPPKREEPKLEPHTSTGSAVLVCVRGGRWAGDRSPLDRLGRRQRLVDKRAEITVWRDQEEAALAERILCAGGCGPWCEHVHAIAWADGTGFHVRSGVHDAPRPSLSEELRQLYPRDGRTPEHLPVDPDFNEPLGKPRVGSDMHDRIQRGERLALRRLLAT
jgi:hypothetical protein